MSRDYLKASVSEKEVQIVRYDFDRFNRLGRVDSLGHLAWTPPYLSKRLHEAYVQSARRFLIPITFYKRKNDRNIQV